jgi:hypothetical protein
MLHAQFPITEFPQAGSLAQLDGETVRIHQLLGSDALVFGEHNLTKRVPIADLAPPPEPTLFDRWRAERVREGDKQARTPVADAFADYQAWLVGTGHDAAYPVTPYAFERTMLLAGMAVTMGYWRAPGDRTARTRRLFPIALRT